jgi:hypothetical protein
MPRVSRSGTFVEYSRRNADFIVRKCHGEDALHDWGHSYCVTATVQRANKRELLGFRAVPDDFGTLVRVPFTTHDGMDGRNQAAWASVA